MISASTGVDVTDFLARHVEMPGTLVYDEALATLGLQLRRKPAKDGEKAWLGAAFEGKTAGTKLAQVYHGGPAHAGGLMAEDVVIAIDGHRVGADLEKRLEVLRPEETVRWTAFRRDRLVEGTVTLGTDPIGELEIVPIEGVSERQRDRFAAWSGSDGSFLSKE